MKLSCDGDEGESDRRGEGGGKDLWHLPAEVYLANLGLLYPEQLCLTCVVFHNSLHQR